MADLSSLKTYDYVDPYMKHSAASFPSNVPTVKSALHDSTGIHTLNDEED